MEYKKKTILLHNICDLLSRSKLANQPKILSEEKRKKKKQFCQTNFARASDEIAGSDLTVHTVFYFSHPNLGNIF
jgi:hypothetical protein